MVSKRATALLRDHEIVDLSDEAQLRGWEILDSINGLRDEARLLAGNPRFASMLAEEDSKGAADLAERIASRNWQRYLRVEIVSMDGAVDPATTVPLREVADLTDASDAWTPGDLKDVDKNAATDVLISPIVRLPVKLREPGADAIPLAQAGERIIPVVWAYAPLVSSGPEGDSSRYLRILLWLPESKSARHLMALTDVEGNFLIRPNKRATADGGDEANLLGAFGEGDRPEIVSKLLAEGTTDSQQRSQIEKLEKAEMISLDVPPFFQEGLPTEALKERLAAEDPSERERFGLQLGDRTRRCWSCERI